MSLLCIIFLLRESHPRLIALRQLRRMNVKSQKSKETQAQPLQEVAIQMLRNKNIILLFFAYFINLIGITNSLTGLVIFTSKMYGFTDSNLSKAYSNIA